MENMRKVAIAVIFVGLASLAVGVIFKLGFFDIDGFGPRAFAGFAAICFLLSINLLLLDKKP